MVIISHVLNYIYNNIAIYINDLTFECRMKFGLIKELWNWLSIFEKTLILWKYYKYFY